MKYNIHGHGLTLKITFLRTCTNIHICLTSTFAIMLQLENHFIVFLSRNHLSPHQYDNNLTNYHSYLITSFSPTHSLHCLLATYQQYSKQRKKKKVHAARITDERPRKGRLERAYMGSVSCRVPRGKG